MLERRFFSAVKRMDPLQRTALFHGLVCPDCQARFLTLLMPGEVQGAVPGAGSADEREREAYKAREDGLAYWGSCRSTPDASLFLSAELFAGLGREMEAARSKAFLSLYFAERENELDRHLATLAYQAAVVHFPLDAHGDQVLFVYLRLAQARTYIALGREKDGVQLLETTVRPGLESEDEGLRIEWLGARARRALGELEVAAEKLEIVLERLTEAREPAACALALLDLAGIYGETGRMRLIEERLAGLRRVFGAGSEEKERWLEDYLGHLEPLISSRDSRSLGAITEGIKEAISALHRFYGGLS